MHHQMINRILISYKGQKVIFLKKKKKEKNPFRMSKKICDEKTKSNHLCRNLYLATLLFMYETEAFSRKSDRFLNSQDS